MEKPAPSNCRSIQNRFTAYLSRLPRNTGSLTDYERGKTWIAANIFATAKEYERFTTLLAKHVGV